MSTILRLTAITPQCSCHFALASPLVSQTLPLDSDHGNTMTSIAEAETPPPVAAPASAAVIFTRSMTLWNVPPVVRASATACAQPSTIAQYEHDTSMRE